MEKAKRVPYSESPDSTVIAPYSESIIWCTIIKPKSAHSLPIALGFPAKIFEK